MLDFEHRLLKPPSSLVHPLKSSKTMHTCKARNHIKEHTQFWNKFLVDWETSDYLQVKGAHCFIAFTKSEGTEKEVAIDTHVI